MAGVLLCVFFSLGVVTGFSRPGRQLARNLSRLFGAWTQRLREHLGALTSSTGNFERKIAPVQAMLRRKGRHPGDARGRTGAFARRAERHAPLALVERADGFYLLSGQGELRGPVLPATQSDLPVLSGPGLDKARARGLVNYAAMLVRAEAQLSRLVSEMRVDDDGTASLFLDRVRMEIVVDPDQEALEVRRAAEILKQWRGREQFVAMLDMTVPGFAVLRLRTARWRPRASAPASGGSVIAGRSR